MAQDVFREASSRGWLSRIGGSIKGVLVGLILFFVAIPLLFWNEGRSVKTYRSLKEGAAAVTTIPVDSVNAAQEGTLVHLTGQATTESVLNDQDFGISDNAIKLSRRVEMYQWVEEKDSETKKKLGGGEETVTTYRYEKEWSDDDIDSGDFKHPEGHINPSEWTWTSEEWVASPVRVGAFELSDGLVSQIDNYEDYDAKAETLPESLRERVKSRMGGYYVGADPEKPEVGDLRVSFSVVRSGPVSIVARQEGSVLKSYQTKAGDAIEMLSTGERTSAEMFKAAQDANKFITWLIRLAGFFMMFIGLAMIMKPLSVLADVVPFIGNIVGFGTGLFAFLIALVVSLVTIAIAWIVVRPVLGIGLLVAALGASFGLRKLRSTKPVVAS